MALDGRRTYVGFGFGAIQAGLFLYEAYRSGAFGRSVVAEVLPARIAALRRAGGYYTLNIAHRNGVEQVTVGPLEIYDPRQEHDRAALAGAIASADEIGTALPSVAYYENVGPGSPHRLLASGFEHKIEQSGPRAVLYAAENDNYAAAMLHAAVDRVLPAAARTEIGAQVRYLDSVIGKMCGLVPAENGLAPITPDDNVAFLVESFNRILISAIDFDKPFHRGIAVFQEKRDLLPFEEAKLFGHNGGHAVAAYLAMAGGVESIARLEELPGALAFVRQAMVDEAGAALVAKYAGLDPLFSPAGMHGYVDDLLSRMTNPFLRDSAARVGRDPARKLGWNDRLVGGIRLACRYGIHPRRLAMGAAAAGRLYQRELGGSVPLATALDGLWHEGDAVERRKIMDLIDEGELHLQKWLDQLC